MHLRRSIRSMPSTGSRLIPLVVGLLALVYLWPLVLHPNWIPMTNILQATDFSITHLPNAQYIHDMWFKYGHPPLWNSSMLSGMPLIADPLSGYGYLPFWLTFLFPVPAAFNLLFVFHLIFTGLGLYLFLRREGVTSLPAIFGAAAWMGTPKLIGYLGGGQFSSVIALCWYPWLLLAIDGLAKSFRPRNALLAAGILSTIILIDIRWGFLAGMLSLAFLFSRIPYRSIRFGKIAQILLLFIVAVGLMTAVLTLPLRELMVRSDRLGITTNERAISSLDSGNLLGILFPQFGILHELITYLGLVVLILAALGLQKRHWFWIGLIGVSVLLSIGQNGPLFPLVSNLVPGADWLRVPSRLWFFVALGCSILAAYGLEKLINSAAPQKMVRWFQPFSFGLSVLAILLSVGVAVFFPPLPKGILTFAVVLPFAFLLVNLILFRPHKRWAFTLILLMICDLVWVNASIFRSVPLERPPEAVRWLEGQPGLFRVYSSTYSIPLPHHLQTAEGVNPTHLRAYAVFMAEASRITTGGYSVSVPGIYLDQFSGPALYQAAASPDLNLLGLLNVKFIVTNYPINISDHLIRSFGRVNVYENPQYRERAWLEGQGSVKIAQWSPDQMVAEVSSNAGGRVVFSEIDYPGWQATLDHQAVPVEIAYNLLRGVNVPAGNHELILSYRPLSFFVGLALSILGWVGFLIAMRSYVPTLLACIRSAFSRKGNI